MLFSKSSKNTIVSQTEITIIGTSPQAFFIGDLLQNISCSVTFLVPENQLVRYKKSFSLTFRPSGFQNRRVEFSFVSEAKKRPSFVFLASNPEDLKNDLLFLSSATLKDVPIVNLSFACTRRLPESLIPRNVYPAFIDGLFMFEKNILTFVSRPQNLKIQTSSDILSELKNLFGSTLIIHKADSPADLFWQDFTPVFLGSLLTQIKHQNISTCLNNSEMRNLADSALKELSVLAKKEKSDFDTSKALTAIYGFADNYTGEFTTKQRLTALMNCFPQISRFETPALFELLAQTLNKY